MAITHADIPRPISAGLIVLDPLRDTPLRVIGMHFNPDSLQRGPAPLAATAVLGKSCDRVEARLQRSFPWWRPGGHLRGMRPR